MLCFGLHQERENPPINPAGIYPYFMKIGCLLWAIECPTQPTTIWVKPNKKMLNKAIWVVQAIKNVQAKLIIRAAYIVQIG